MDKDDKKQDVNEWGVPENPSKFSGWNAALSPIFAMAAMLGALAIAEPQAAKDILMTPFKAFTGDTAKDAPAPKP